MSCMAVAAATTDVAPCRSEGRDTSPSVAATYSFCSRMKMLDDTPATEWSEHPANLDVHRNTTVWIYNQGSDADMIWSCELLFQTHLATLRSPLIEECNQTKEGRQIKPVIEAAFDEDVPQGIWLHYLGTPVWQPWPNHDDAVTQTLPQQRVWPEVWNLSRLEAVMDGSELKYDCERFSVFVGRQETSPFANIPLNIDAYHMLEDCGAPRLVLAAKSQPHWVVTRDCGRRLADWQRLGYLTVCTWHQVGSLLRDTLRKVHALGWAIRTPMTPESIWFDCDIRKERNTRDGDMPPYDYTDPNGPSEETWAPVHGVFFVDLRKAGPATVEERRVDVENLRFLIAASLMTCDHLDD